MKFSVIIPTKGNTKLLTRCLNSIKSQKFRKFELIIVSNKIDENIYRISKAYRARLIQDRLGTLGNAYLSGIKVAKGDLIIFIMDSAL